SFPYYSLRHQFGYAWNASNPHNYPAWNDGEGTEITVPARDGSGEMTINPVERVQELATLQDEQAVAEAVQDLHWVANVDLPMLPFETKTDQSFYTDGGDWEAPDGDSEKAKVDLPSLWLPRQGDIRYVGE
ncbi:MAG: ABC transporter substrate-binding protein, partial [Halorhabdus sp.]